MSFFIGQPDDSEGGFGGNAVLQAERDDLASGIARQARRFILERLRWEDMRSYMFSLLIEASLLTAVVEQLI